MNNTQTLVKQTIENSVKDCFLTWLLSEREMQEILISVAGDIAVGNYLITGDDGFVTLSRPTQDAADLPKARGATRITCPICDTVLGVVFAKSASG